MHRALDTHRPLVGIATSALQTGWDETLESILPAWVPDRTIEVVAAIFILFAGWYLGKLVVRVTGRYVAQHVQRPSITRTILRSIRAGVFAFGIALAARVLGVGGGEILLSVTVFSAVVGIVLAPLVGSFVNGFFVLADQPFEIGDLIELTDEGHRGFVEDITIRYTKIFTLDNTLMVIPNGTIRERDVVNYSGEDERTRLSASLLVTYEGDLAQARRIMERAASEVDEVITGGPPIRIGSSRYPARPTCYIEDYADSGVLLTLRYWVKTPYKLLTVRSKVYEGVWERLAEADVEIAYPHRHLVFDENSGEAHVATRSWSSTEPSNGDEPFEGTDRS